MPSFLPLFTLVYMQRGAGGRDAVRRCAVLTAGCLITPARLAAGGDTGAALATIGGFLLYTVILLHRLLQAATLRRTAPGRACWRGAVWLAWRERCTDGYLPRCLTPELAGSMAPGMATTNRRRRHGRWLALRTWLCCWWAWSGVGPTPRWAGLLATQFLLQRLLMPAWCAPPLRYRRMRACQHRTVSFTAARAASITPRLLLRLRMAGNVSC